MTPLHEPLEKNLDQLRYHFANDEDVCIAPNQSATVECIRLPALNTEEPMVTSITSLENLNSYFDRSVDNGTTLEILSAVRCLVVKLRRLTSLTVFSTRRIHGVVLKSRRRC